MLQASSNLRLAHPARPQPRPACPATPPPQAVRAPQELHAGMQAVAAHCQRVLASKEGVMAAARALLARRDEQYVRLLRAQREETDGLVAAMHARHAACRAAQEAQLEAAEGAFLQVRPLEGGLGWVEGWGWSSIVYNLVGSVWASAWVCSPAPA